MFVEFEQQAGYEFGVSHNSVMQITQASLVLVGSRVTSHSISGIPLDALSVLDNSFLSDESGNLLKMILDSGAEEHSGIWTLWPLSRHDENSNGVSGPSTFAWEKQQRHHGASHTQYKLPQTETPERQCCPSMVLERSI